MDIMAPESGTALIWNSSAVIDAKFVFIGELAFHLFLCLGISHCEWMS